jgi:phage tail-like protein
MNKNQEQNTKQLIDYLPAIYRDGEKDEGPSFVSLYLRSFERILFGGKQLKALDPSAEPQDAIPSGLEEEVAAIPLLFDPMRTPVEFLPWLASWVALSFHPDLPDKRRRKLLANIVPLYRIRGTRRYIEQLLTICLDMFVSVDDLEIPPLQIGEHSTLGEDTYVGGGSPYFFSVRLLSQNVDQATAEIQKAIAHEILALAKPAHTFYNLALSTRSLQVGVHSRIGLDTVLGD